jgi:hypothetical protein
MDIGIYFDKTDYLGECTLNVIDQVMFIEHYQEVSNYISENYIELKENQFYLEAIEPVKWGVDKLQKAKDLEANKDKGTFIAKAWNFIQRMFLNILGSVLTFFARIANVIIGLLNSKFNWKNIKEYWSSIDQDIKKIKEAANNKTEEELGSALGEEGKNTAKTFEDNVITMEDLENAGSSEAPEKKESANFNDLYSYSYFREDAKPAIFTKLINLLPGMQKKVVSGVMEDISVLTNNNLLIHTVMGSIALKAYVNAIMNLVNASIKTRLNQEYEVEVIGGKKVSLSYIKILNFFNTNMNQGIWEIYEKYCNTFGYKRMRAYIDKCKITTKDLKPVEEMDPQVRSDLDSDFMDCPKIIEELQIRCRTFYKFLRSYLKTINDIIQQDGKYQQLHVDTRSTLIGQKDYDQGTSGYYKKDFDWDTGRASGDDYVDPNTVSPIFGLDEDIEIMRFVDDIEMLQFYKDINDAKHAGDEVRTKISNLIKGKKDVEEELDSRIKLSKKISGKSSATNTKPAQEIAKFIRKTVAECKDSNKIMKYQNLYMDVYDKARSFIEIAKAKLKLINFDRDYEKNKKE